MQKTVSHLWSQEMNDYEMLHLRVDKLRIILALNHVDQFMLQRKSTCILEELLDVRRQITKADRQVKFVLDTE